MLLTYNEALHIDRALNSIAAIATQIFVIDSGSTDGTVEMAETRGATVLHNPWTNHATQFQWALDNAPITANWVMRLDADEIIEPDLAAEITARLNGLPSEVTGVNFKRKHIFMGRWVRHGGRYPLVMLRLWRRGQARVEQRWMDEHILLLSGESITFEGGFADHNLNDLTFFTDKHNKYATLEAIDVINQRCQLFPRDIGLRFDRAPSKAARTRLIKEKIYNRIPFQLSALGYFLYRYIIQAGFLDGPEGAIYHVLQGFWYRYLVGAKVVELEAAIKGLAPPEATAKLKKLTGLNIG